MPPPGIRKQNSIPSRPSCLRDIDKDTVDFVDNYDATMKEPTLLPVGFPSILVNNNVGIAVGMASSICSFNLTEVCETTIALMKDPDHDILSTLQAPDFPGGGLIVYDRTELEKVYESGRGGIKVRSVYAYDKEANCIDVTEIPHHYHGGSHHRQAHRSGEERAGEGNCGCAQ